MAQHEPSPLRTGTATNSRFACLGIVIGPDDMMPLVREFRRPNPLWKLPGGRNQGSETPEETLLRELSEETGLRVAPESVQELDKIEHSNHDQFVFAARVYDFSGLQEFGEENDNTDLEIRLFPSRLVLSQMLLPPHRLILGNVARQLQQLGIYL